ncbi:unannotated protein [freshwater metagenome]|uniref:Unannotated protein n=1 Tax=freshwater metagenome TaxID=449393 RepID=A0A6J6J5D5_9ZZZZ
MPSSFLLLLGGKVIRITAQVTNKYVAALKIKTCPVVAPQLTRTATRMGPVTREPFTDAELKLMEPPRSSGRTKLGSTAENAGALIALPMPTVI